MMNNNDELEIISELSFNRPQLNFISWLPAINSATLIWGRGTGKSSGIGFLIKYIVKHMPRSMWVIQGATFQQLLTRTLPGTFAFIEKLGLKRDVDFFISRFPPKGIELPFESPLKPDNCIFFVNHQYKCAVGFSLFSQDRSSSRGPNRDGVICDESLLLDWDKFTTETLATVRGNDAYFDKVSIHKGVFHFTSMPTGESKLFEGGEYLQKQYNFRELCDKRIDLMLSFVKESSKQIKLEIWQEIVALSKKMRFYPNPKNKLLYSEFNSFDNIENLGLKYIQQQYDSQPLLLFLIEILNKKSSHIVNKFYPALSMKEHGYKGKFNYAHIDSLELLQKTEDVSLDSRQDDDCIPALPLHLGIDFGAAINWFITAQHIKSLNQLNFIKDMYVKSPYIIDDLANKWCDYYEHHPKKLVYLYPGADGHDRRPNVKGQASYVDQIMKILRKRGWIVIDKKSAKYEFAHHEKYLCWARALAQADKRYPKVKINLINAGSLFLVMDNTPAIDYGGRIKKDKSSEKDFKHNREEATDAGDAADQIMFGIFGYLNKGFGNFVTSPMSV